MEDARSPIWIGFISFLLFTFVPGIHAATGFSSTQFIKSSCKVTRYPQLCFESLSAYNDGSAITSSKQLARAALSVSLSKARSTSAVMSNLSSATKGLKHREVAAMKDCVDTVKDSVYQLHRSMKEMEHLSRPKMRFMMSNIETWVSAALTDEQTCMDGFAGKELEGKLKSKVRSNIVKVAQLTSNALALINSYAASQGYSP